MDVATGRVREVAPDWDRSPGSLAVADDGKTLFVSAQDTGQYPLFRVDAATGKVERLVGDGSVSAFDVAGQTIALTRNALDTGNVLYVTDAVPRAAAQDHASDGGAPDVESGAFEQFTFRAGDATVHGYVAAVGLPDGRKYPVAFLIHGTCRRWQRLSALEPADLRGQVAAVMIDSRPTGWPGLHRRDHRRQGRQAAGRPAWAGRRR